jgi:hypothetical protein
MPNQSQDIVAPDLLSGFGHAGFNDTMLATGGVATDYATTNDMGMSNPVLAIDPGLDFGKTGYNQYPMANNSFGTGAACSATPINGMAMPADQDMSPEFFNPTPVQQNGQDADMPDLTQTVGQQPNQSADVPAVDNNNMADSNSWPSVSGNDFSFSSFGEEFIPPNEAEQMFFDNEPPVANPLAQPTHLPGEDTPPSSPPPADQVDFSEWVEDCPEFQL